MDWLRLAYLRLASQRGQTMAEYGIIIAVIAVVVIIAASLFGTSLTGVFRGAASKL